MEKTGFTSFLTFFMISLLIIVTIHMALDFCVWSNFAFIVFAFSFPCLGLNVDCPWCSCFLNLLDLCPCAFGLCLWGKLMYLFDKICYVSDNCVSYPIVWCQNLRCVNCLVWRAVGVGVGGVMGVVPILSVGYVEYFLDYIFEISSYSRVINICSCVSLITVYVK